MRDGWWGWRTIYGADKEHWTPYQTAVWIGRLRLHVFHRGDADPDFHDHPWPFWTFPLTTYRERIYKPALGLTFNNTVAALRWHYRPATHAHRVLGRCHDFPGGFLRRGKIVTLVWRGEGGRSWGFWRVRDGEPVCWRDWKHYIFGGGKHAPCEAGGRSR